MKLVVYVTECYLMCEKIFASLRHSYRSLLGVLLCSFNATPQSILKSPSPLHILSVTSYWDRGGTLYRSTLFESDRDEAEEEMLPQ